MAFHIIQLIPGSPEAADRLQAFGFKLTGGGAHISRTMMLEEVTQLLASTSASATTEGYRQAAIERNALGKSTETTRVKTFRHLRELYGLSEGVPLFAIYRELVHFDLPSAPLLSFLVAWARDPLFRATTPAVRSANVGVEVTRDDLQRVFMGTYPSQYSALNVAKIARNAASSWTQSGHLSGRTTKIRCHVEARPAALTLSLLLGHITELGGERLFSSIWCQLLDLNAAEARSLATTAHREGLITMRGIGSVVDISFPRFNKYLEGFR